LTLLIFVRFAKVEITASPPIVPFRETIVEPPTVDMVNELIQTQQHPTSKPAQRHYDSNQSQSVSDVGLIVQQTVNKKSTIKLRAIPLPKEVTDTIDEFSDLLKLMKKRESVEAPAEKVSEFRTKLSEAFETSGWKRETADRIWSFGPHHTGPNILLNEVKDNPNASIWPEKIIKSDDGNSESTSGNFLYAYASNFINGFQLATIAGPLCEEPLRGVAFQVEEWSCEDVGNELSSNQPFGPFSGQIMSAVKEACRKAFQVQPQRLMAAMYSSSIQVNSEVLGKSNSLI